MKYYISKYKRRIYAIRTVTWLLFLVFVYAVIFLGNGLIEKGPVNNEIDDFKARAVFEKTTTLQGQDVSYYKVTKKYDYEDTEHFIYDTNRYEDCYIGSMTDIILTSRNPLRKNGNAIVRDISGFFAKNFFIGHATINIKDDGSELIEAVGNDSSNNGVRISKNSWIETEVRYGNDAQIIIGLRLKNTTKESRDKITNDLIGLVGHQYNFLLPFYSKDKYYCTDLISRVLKRNGIKTNYDSFYTTGNDLIVSNQTYIIFLCERVEDGYFNIYYLSEE